MYKIYLFPLFAESMEVFLSLADFGDFVSFSRTLLVLVLTFGRFRATSFFTGDIGCGVVSALGIFATEVDTVVVVEVDGTCCSIVIAIGLGGGRVVGCTVPIGGQRATDKGGLVTNLA